MRDGTVAVICLLLVHPGRPLKHYIELSGLARATFFKAKQDLQAREVIRIDDAGQLGIDRTKAMSVLEEAYPGFSRLLVVDAGEV